MSRLSEIVKNIRQPEFNDEMIEKLCRAFGEESFYMAIQECNSLKDNSMIDRGEEQAFWDAVTPGYKQGESFQHMGTLSDIEYCFCRLYINCSKQDVIKFSRMFAEACRTQGLTFDFKYACSSSKRSDQIVIYSNISSLNEYIQILQDIKLHSPEMVERCGAPPLLTATLDDWIGIGEEPSDSRKSYTEVRANIIKQALSKFETFDDEGFQVIQNIEFDKIREEIARLFKENGLSIDNVAFCAENMAIMENEETIQAFDTSKRQEINNRRQSNKDKYNQKKEFTNEWNHLQKLKLLQELGVMPDGFENVLNAGNKRYAFLSDMERLSIGNGYNVGTISPEESQKLIGEIQRYYTEYFEKIAETIQESIERYSQLESEQKGVDPDVDIERADLYTKLTFLANAKQLFEYIGVPVEKIEAVCGKASASLDKSQEINQDELEGTAHRSAVDIIINELQGTGITTSEGLRDYYDKQIKDNYQLTDIELEAALREVLHISEGRVSVEPDRVSNKTNLLQSIKAEGIGLKEVYSAYGELDKDLQAERDSSRGSIDSEGR